MNETIENRLVFQSVNLIENEEKMYSNTSAKNDIMPPFPASTVQKMCTKPNRVKRAGLQLKSERAKLFLMPTLPVIISAYIEV